METSLCVGIVGSRRRATLFDRKIVHRLVEWLVHNHQKIIIVSGGCPVGADAFAEEAAKLYDQPTHIFHIDKTGVSTKWQFTTKAYERNAEIAKNSDRLYALISDDRTGGTENTIKHALELGKPVYLVTSNGEVYLSKDGQNSICAPEVRLLDLNFTD